MASGSLDDWDESDIKDTENHEEYEKNIYSPDNKEKMIRGIKGVENKRSEIKDGSIIAAGVAGGIAGGCLKKKGG